ncbi:helix-turn-helix transcriptional regulator [Selenomonas sp. WCA-380-WT-3B 3/]|uniref:Helix-turn-helix transcriptional regulator n=1 Tax=Selenomonas montiformis TaxID=2652285 RepID=A0A6I2UWN1_9FIRM|nr:helix-turn-helix transcriptional regulator [Selenomonas montiformis]MSV23686.1 helix-turn-helix transcriptional regulator [Selenomonas montiformis]
MTDKEKEEIAHLRRSGMGYGKIAEFMSLSISTVKSYCIRNKLTAGGGQMVCLECGKPIIQPPEQKGKKFCSDACRIKWWNHHTWLMKANNVCAHCGKPFHGRKDRKYCSHACYIAERFGEAHVS